MRKKIPTSEKFERFVELVNYEPGIDGLRPWQREAATLFFDYIDSHAERGSGKTTLIALTVWPFSALCAEIEAGLFRRSVLRSNRE